LPGAAPDNLSRGRPGRLAPGAAEQTRRQPPRCMLQWVTLSFFINFCWAVSCSTEGARMPSVMTQTNGDVLVVYFTDSQILDEAKISQLNQELVKAADKAAGGKLLLNFNDVQFMSSAVLGKLIALNKKCKADETTIKLCSIAPSIMEVFKITNLHRVFEIHEDETKAISAFNKKKWFFS
jgi:anti-sigma B factor antagonist